MSYRIRRVNSLIKEELSKILLEELDLEQGLIVTVTGVETSADLRHSKIITSIFPSSKAQYVIDFLEKNIYNIQQILNKRLNMRPIPKIRFEVDKSEENQDVVEETLKKIHKTE